MLFLQSLYFVVVHQHQTHFHLAYMKPFVTEGWAGLRNTSDIVPVHLVVHGLGGGSVGTPEVSKRRFNRKHITLCSYSESSRNANVPGKEITMNLEIPINCCYGIVANKLYFISKLLMQCRAAGFHTQCLISVLTEFCLQECNASLHWRYRICCSLYYRFFLFQKVLEFFYVPALNFLRLSVLYKLMCI